MIEIIFDKQPAEFQPGEMISGNINWNDLAIEDWAFEARLLWYTEKRYNARESWQPVNSRERDLKRSPYKVIAHQKTIATSSKGSRPFMFPAPIGPFSFKGNLLALCWSVEVESANETSRKLLSLSLTGKEIVLRKSYKDGKPLTKRELRKSRQRKSY